MKIVGVVPIKTNNERLPGKNIRLLGEKPLLRYILETLLLENRIQERYVYTSEERIESLFPEGITLLRRDKSLDLPTSNFNQIFEAFKKEVDADIYVYAHATAPFIEVETLSKCLDAVMYGGFDSAFTAERIQDFLWRDNEPLNFEPENLPRSQELPMIYRETSGVYVFTKEMYQRLHRRVGETPYICEVNKREAIDINTAEDFDMAERLL